MPQEVIEITEREIEIIEVIERGPVGPTGPQPDINYEVVSSARTLEAADLIAADTSGGSFTLTLPANPSNGDAVDIFDFSETFDTNPLTIARNGQPIESLNEDLVANVEGAYFTLIYTGSTRGWQVLPRYGTSGGGGESALTTQGDMLYRGAAVNTRLGIGTAGQILKVNSSATAPEWGEAPATGVTSVSGTAPIASSGGATPTISISPATTSAAGSMSSADKTKLDGITGTNTGDQTITLTGNVTGSGTGSFAATIANDAVDNTKLSNMAQSTLKGRATLSTGDPEDLTASQVRTILNVADGATANTASTATPSALGTAAAGTATAYAREDHVHAMPSASDVGAAAATHASSHATGAKAVFAGQVDGMNASTLIRADNVGAAGNITLTFDGVDDISAVVAAWNAANPSNTVSVDFNDGEVPNNLETITLTGGIDAGSDPISSASFQTLTIADYDEDNSIVRLRGVSNNIIEFETQELSLNHTGGNDTPYISVSDGTAEALLGLRQGEMFLQGSNPVVRIEQGGGTLADIKMRDAIVEGDVQVTDMDTLNVGKFTAFEALTANRTYDLPDASGTLVLDSDLGPTATSNSYDDLDDLPTLGTAAAADIGTAAGEVAEGDHTHELDELDATGATNGHVLTADGSGAASWQAAAGGGVTGAAASASDVLGVSGSDITGVDATADRIVFWDDSASALKYLEAGSGLSISGTTLTATASGGSKTYAVFTAEHNQPPATAFATLDTRNSIAVLDFDAATDENAVFVGIIPEGASLGSGLKIRLHWMATTATSGNVVWDVSLERMTTDLDADSFDTIASGTAAANGTSGILTVTEITLTTIDSVTAGDGYRLKVTRDANNASDTMTGDAELVVVEIRSAA